ncbi:hypothetical protein [Pseudomonas veronii]|uniref:hypothetical protein n=1 Tax=Pseudomonas veronii TaxID=76761 RepID=UPI0021BEDD51|nr:hypothetical protein [Pseudomonas veronii]MCT9827480.1 hypothetical protein [Pseudomonas veronii]
MAINSGNISTLVEHCLSEFVKAAQQAPAIYFAPVRGAISGVISQWLKLQSRDADGGTPKAA